MKLGKGRSGFYFKRMLLLYSIKGFVLFFLLEVLPFLHLFKNSKTVNGKKSVQNVGTKAGKA